MQTEAATLLACLAPCHNIASTLVIIGIGDGEILRQIDADPQLRAKDIFALALPGDEVPATTGANVRIAKAHDWESTQQWLFERFGAHQDIVRLAGADFCEDHPLAPEAEACRAAILPRIRAALADRPWALGNDINDTFMGLYHASLNAKALLPSPSLGNICGVFGDTPCISIGAGPSVKDHLEELRNLQDKAILVACDAVYPALIKEGIVPHFVTPLERLKQQAQLLTMARGTRTIFAGIPACHPDTVGIFGDKTIYVHAMDKLYDWLAPKEELRCLTGSSTGVLSFLVAASLNRGAVYLVGHDLAKGSDGSTHVDGCDFATKAQAKETSNSGAFGANGYETRFVPGNDGNLVESIMWWDTFRLEISTQAKLCPGRIFNVNAHAGKYARIENTGSAPLPHPDSLPGLPDIKISKEHHHRYADWKDRTKLLPEDCRRFISGMAAYRQDLANMSALKPEQWQMDDLLLRMSPCMNVSPGNADAFGYFLRSAIYNEQMYMSHRARSYTNRNQAFHHTFQSLDALADALTKAVAIVQPCLEEIAHADH